MVTPQDVVIALSNSGESNEILALIPVLKRQQVKLICITSRPESSMARGGYPSVRESAEGGLPVRTGAHVEHHRRAGDG